jgi:hypothetical protein
MHTDHAAEDYTDFYRPNRANRRPSYGRGVGDSAAVATIYEIPPVLPLRTINWITAKARSPAQNGSIAEADIPARRQPHPEGKSILKSDTVGSASR